MTFKKSVLYPKMVDTSIILLNRSMLLMSKMLLLKNIPMLNKCCRSEILSMMSRNAAYSEGTHDTQKCCKALLTPIIPNDAKT